VLGLANRSQLPLWVAAVYRHRAHPDQEIELTRVHYYLPADTPEDKECMDFYSEPFSLPSHSINSQMQAYHCAYLGTRISQ